ncbi:hypothetical protein DICPUDRAFT_158170 [Dictyostelium purpureum]|uniref:Uncharacterized protein n=1 Tax=Dictyostelium purpureum TaxID=5786 RepID=F1A102_DICPU|nr:uncharacterized protein DICPUDRAFT_158170 [Dictyostelium purpureum]EGC30139.1 hypothetical protein DICPUDRAFT_158170 [Dictyostelium purpureum]|eukprot:XP_003293347.1 hypothetical protein DICPUDRAFT_158170 [Dictyostelium purpureum]
MKLIVSLLIIVLIFITGSLCIPNGSIYISPTMNNEICESNFIAGIGYSLPYESCVNFGNSSVYTSGNGLSFDVYWMDNCQSKQILVNYTFANFGCSNFYVPNSPTFQSIVSSEGVPPRNALVYTYYYNSKEGECSGDSYYKYYTNQYVLPLENGKTVEYTCVNNFPIARTCQNLNCQDTDYSLGTCNNADSNNPYPYTITCSNTPPPPFGDEKQPRISFNF